MELRSKSVQPDQVYSTAFRTEVNWAGRNQDCLDASGTVNDGFDTYHRRLAASITGSHSQSPSSSS